MKFEIPIEIASQEISEKRGTSKQGRPFVIREQRGYVDLGRQYPVEIRVPLDDSSQPYSSGRYIIDRECLFVDRYGALSLGRLRLKRVSDVLSS
jgi:hypothetical protein